jgi:hypothetical protein
MSGFFVCFYRNNRRSSLFKAPQFDLQSPQKDSAFDSQCQQNHPHYQRYHQYRHQQLQQTEHPQPFRNQILPSAIITDVSTACTNFVDLIWTPYN